MGAGGGIRPSWGPRAPSGGSEAAPAGRERRTGRADGRARPVADCADPAHPAWPQVPWMRPPRVSRPLSVPAVARRPPASGRLSLPGSPFPAQSSAGGRLRTSAQAARPLGRDGSAGKRKTSRGIEPLRAVPRVVGAYAQ